jgi:hypothetical protein
MHTSLTLHIDLKLPSLGPKSITGPGAFTLYPCPFPFAWVWVQEQKLYFCKEIYRHNYIARRRLTRIYFFGQKQNF